MGQEGDIEVNLARIPTCRDPSPFIHWERPASLEDILMSIQLLNFILRPHT